MRWITEFTGEMTVIADPRIVRREQFLVNMTTRRTAVRFQLFFRQRFHRYIGGYDIFHSMRQIVARTTLYSFHRDGTNNTSLYIARSILY